jgi:outer membrane biosynthesis protein TonB
MPSEMITNAWLESDDGRQDPWFASGESPYHAGVRTALSPSYQGLSTEEIDDLVDRVMESATAEDAEDFGSFLSDLGRTVAPIAAKVLPVAAPIVGTLIGGPAGTVVGNMVGQYAGQALGGAAPAPKPVAPRPAPQPVARPIPQPVARPTPQPVPQAAPQAVAQPVPEPVAQAEPQAAPTTPPAPTSIAPVTPPSPAATSALAQLIALLDSPALRQLLAGQVLGSAGVKTVPVGPENIPVNFPTMMEALSVLAGNAAETATSYGESAEAESTAYLQDASGRFVYDPAVPEERASALVAQLRAGEAASGSFGESTNESVGDWLTRAGVIQ